MANKYSRYQLQPYVSQYVDPGTTQINAMLRQRWETNKAKHDQLQQLANSTQVGKGDQKWKDAAIDEIRTTFNDTIQTNAYENAGVVVSDAVNSFIANEPLKAAAESYNTYALEQLASMGRPCQWLLFAKPGAGVTAEYLVKLANEQI